MKLKSKEEKLIVTYKLYGDGIHDDTKAIQELIDSGVREVCLPEPEVKYIISAPLELPSNFKLKLPRYAEIMLAKDSNCVMLKNKTVTDVKKRKNKGIFDYLNVFSPDAPCENIEVEGGIWNYNNLEQKTNPLLEKKEDGLWHWKACRKQIDNDIDSDDIDTISYNGYTFLFYNVKNLKISSLTLKDPITFAVTLDVVSFFTVDDITFDFNYGNPLACNMDGIHLNGGCHYGHITNLKGACYDDLVALNADEGPGAPITNITIDGIYATDCHSAVRLLSANYPVKNIHITNVYGTYFQYCIGITRYYEPKTTGYYEGIVIDNVFASKAERYDVYNHINDFVYAPIHFDDRIVVRDIKISNLHRDEYINPVSTFYVGTETVIERLMLDNISVENNTAAEDIPWIENNGEIKKLYTNAIYKDGVETEFE